METKTKENQIERPPVVVVMGHIDHGKSTLLDYIRKSNVVEKEAGGITQHISAYEVIHKDENGKDKKITFLDTPGHESFSAMRERGAKVADIAILVVSAEDGVKPQTKEAWKTIIDSKTPYVVAINKIDKPGANVEKTKQELAENEIYLENYGGNVPFAEISAKSGQGIDNLLSLILILAELENFTANPTTNASGFVLEVNLDSKRGIQATLVIKDGKIKKGMSVASGSAIVPVRIMENFVGKMIDEATFSSPIRLVGWDKAPQVGAEFKVFNKKSEAEEAARNGNTKVNKNVEEETDKKVIAILLKADAWGSIEALEKEIEKIKQKNKEKSALFRIVNKGVGPISENDIKSVAIGDAAIALGFHVNAVSGAAVLAEQKNVTIATFDIIYKLTEWLEEELEKRRPRVETMETTGRAKIIKTFSRTKERQIIGGKVIEGSISLGSTVKIMRRDFEIGRGKIVNLEKGKAKSSTANEGEEFGMMIESKFEIAGGDVIEGFATVVK